MKQFLSWVLLAVLVTSISASSTVCAADSGFFTKNQRLYSCKTTLHERDEQGNFQFRMMSKNDEIQSDGNVDGLFESLHIEMPSAQNEEDFSPVNKVESIVKTLALAQKSTKKKDASIPVKRGENDEVRAVWFSYIEWKTMLMGLDQKQFEQKLAQLFENMKSLQLNTLVMHARAYGDAMYESDFYPWSKYTSGAIGQSPGYDPFALVVQRAREQGISVHAWINPMRTMTAEEFAGVDDSNLLKQWFNNTENRYKYFMVDGSARYILNPAMEEVRTFIANGAAEIAKKYAVDAIHIDDYFYPSGVDGLVENDKRYHDEVDPNGDLGAFRRNNTSVMVKQMYDAIKQANPNVQFGVSPQSSVGNNYNHMFIDVKQWVTTPGYIDYIMPQVYFGFQNSGQPFEKRCRTGVQ